MEEKFCSKCGARLDKDASFCSSCGNNMGFDSPKTQKLPNINRNFIIIGILSILIILFVVGILFSTGGTNINGLKFNIPNGFKEIEHNVFDDGEYYKYQNMNQFITITVKDTPGATLDNLGTGKLYSSGYSYSTPNKVINGKEGIVNFYYESCEFTYIDNGKTVTIKLSSFLSEWESALNNIIK